MWVTLKLETGKGLTVMATISGGAPMLGFLGTVTRNGACILRNGERRKGNIDILFSAVSMKQYAYGRWSGLSVSLPCLPTTIW